MTQPRVLNRRQLIRAAVGASTVPFLVPLLATSSKPETAAMPPAAPGQTFVVVFHGLFAFLFGAKGKDILVVVPNQAAFPVLLPQSP
jgi:hypothetical protein